MAPAFTRLAKLAGKEAARRGMTEAEGEERLWRFKSEAMREVARKSYRWWIKRQ